VPDRVVALRLGYRTAAGAFGWALVNWIADVACLVCAIKAVGEPVPWAAILVVWTAGVGAASFSPVSAGVGIVDIVLITVAWLIYRHMAWRRRKYAPESPASSRRAQNSAQVTN
jgi:hypothetical protein